MTLSNQLTISRMVMAAFFMFFLFSKGLNFKVLALLTFCLASYTDFLDGYFAKKRNEITNFGKIMDPIADKILTLSAFLAFVEMKLIPAWMVVVIIARELAITGLRLAMLAKGEVVAAGIGGKHKTVSQILSIFLILVFIVIKEAGEMASGFWTPELEYWYKQIIFVMMLITVAFTVISGASYVIRNKIYVQT